MAVQENRAEGRCVIKRDGRVVPWDASRITRAVALAFYDVKHHGAPNPARDDPDRRYGLDEATFAKAEAIAERATKIVQSERPTIEEIQDAVEKAIAELGEWEVARSFIIYRQKKAELRLRRYEENGLSEFIAIDKYARYRPDLKRRELFPEAVARVEAMHLKRFGDIAIRPGSFLPKAKDGPDPVAKQVAAWLGQRSLPDCIREAFDAVREKRILPSMRSLQFGGPAIEATNARMFNCCFSPVDRVEFFREYFYLLLAGSGCGFSVQTHHIARLPELPVRGNELDLPVKHWTVADSIEGWSDALHELLLSYFNGYKAEFNFSQIRPRGAPLKTSGGRAPGHLPLKYALADVERLLTRASGRRLKPIEAYDLCMFVARSVIAGGTRRSATICLFSPDDAEMMAAKSGNWLSENPQRNASNNSAVLDRSSENRAQFHRLFHYQRQFGEPGFYFTSANEYGCNPCCEIGLHPVARGPFASEDVRRLRELGYGGELTDETRLSGWQMCNLCTINAARVESEEDFNHACHLAAILGTLQAAYVDMPYLGPVTRFLNERESLLGVSICGIMDKPSLFLDPKILESGAAICRATNATIAPTIGIRPAARTTCVKPEGTTSLLLETGSGIHPHHAKRYFRRIQINRTDPVYLHFKEKNPHMTESSVHHPDSDDVITFPESAPDGALLRSDLTAIQFLEHVKLVQRHWVEAGRADDTISPGLHHNVSNTCTVRPDEWEAVEEFIWQNRRFFTGISLLPASGDKLYPQAPREEVTTEEDIAKWNHLVYRKVDYSRLREESDQTTLQETPACAGGVCET